MCEDTVVSIVEQREKDNGKINRRNSKETILPHPKTLLDFKHLSDSDVVDVCRPKISDLGEDIN
jgi:hypothetical protein